MTYLQLLPHVSFAIVDGRAVFLDLRRDRYFALDQAAAAAFDTLRCGSNGLASAELAAPLLATGMFAPVTEPSEYLPTEIPSAERGLADDVGPPRLKDLIQILFHVVRSRRAVRLQPLDQVIARRRGRGSDRFGSRPPDSTLALALRFRGTRALIPVKPTCLQDSLALHDWLAGRGAFPLLVLGVRLDPFAAHCWVQLGRTVLNDAPDRVATYTPILVVE